MQKARHFSDMTNTPSRGNGSVKCHFGWNIFCVCGCFCAAVVEACLLHGLKRRIAGLLCSNKVAALFMKVAKNFSPAEQLCQKVHELEQLIENR